MFRSLLFVVALSVSLSLLMQVEAQTSCQPVTSCQEPQVQIVPSKIPIAPIPECMCDSCPCNDELPPLPQHVIDAFSPTQQQKTNDDDDGGKLWSNLKNQKDDDDDDSIRSVDLNRELTEAKRARAMRLIHQREFLKAKVEKHREDLSRLKEIASELKAQFKLLNSHRKALTKSIKLNKDAIRAYEAAPSLDDFEGPGISATDLLKQMDATHVQQANVLSKTQKATQTNIKQNLKEADKIRKEPTKYSDDDIFVMA